MVYSEEKNKQKLVCSFHENLEVFHEENPFLMKISQNMLNFPKEIKDKYY